MTYPQYQSYKQCDTSWIDKIPEHWTLSRLKHAVAVYMGQSPKSEDCNQEGNGIPFLQGCSEFGKEHPVAEQFCNVASKIAQVSDFLLSVRAPVGKLNIADQPYGIGRGLCSIRTNHSSDRRYIFYWLNTVTKELESVATGSTYQAVSVDQVAGASVLVPPLKEQVFIARFLDRETTKIDALIAEQERLIELLQEKRQAVISHAVTNGLNPNVPMKDSGVEWLGKVPEHWKIQKGSRIGKVFGSEQVPEENVNQSEGIPFIKVSSLDTESFEPNQTECLVQRSLLRAKRGEQNFIAFPKRGAAIFGNKVNIISYEAIIDPNVMGWSINPSINPLYIAHVLKMRRLEEIADVSTVPQINNKHISQEWWPLPPRHEQDSICELLEHENRSCKNLICLAKKVIMLLQERRSALISAAVTGQIDVRALVPEAEIGA